VDDFQSIVSIVFWPVVKVNLSQNYFCDHMNSEIEGEESKLNLVALNVMKDNLIRG
jgi:hypothetical protein